MKGVANDPLARGPAEGSPGEDAGIRDPAANEFLQAAPVNNATPQIGAA